MPQDNEKPSAQESPSTSSTEGLQILQVSVFRDNLANILNAASEGVHYRIVAHNEVRADLVPFDAEQHDPAETIPRKMLHRHAEAYLARAQSGKVIRVCKRGDTGPGVALVKAPVEVLSESLTEQEKLEQQKLRARDRRAERNPGLREKRLDIALTADERLKLELIKHLSPDELKRLIESQNDSS